MLSKILYFYPRNADKEIDAVQNGSGEFGSVPFNMRFTTDTGFFFVSKKSARARVQSSDEDEFCRIGITGIDSIDADLPVFEGLSEHLQEFPVELQEFVEEEYSLVSEADLPRTTIPSSSDDADIARGMVDFSEWARENKRMVLRKESRDRIYLGYIYDLREIHIGKDGRKSFGEHGFSGSGRSFHEYVVTSGRRDSECSLGVLLPDDVLKSSDLYS